MARFTPRYLTDFLKRMAYRVVARSGLTDLEPGGQLHTILAAVARELDDIHFQMVNLMKLWDLDTATGEDLDRRAEDVNPDEIKRLGAVKATGTVVFSANSAVASDVTILAGTIVRVSGSSEYKTSTSATILTGFTDSASTAIVALEAGEDGNCDAAAVDDMDRISGVDSVTNDTACTGGQDEETDQQLRDRIRAYQRSLGRATPDALKYAALNVSVEGYGRIVTAEVVEGVGADLGIVTVYVDDGTGTVEATDDNYGTPESVVTTATGGEIRLFLDSKPVDQDEAVTIVWNDGSDHTLIEDDDFTLNYATGQITLIPGGTASIPATGLGAGDSVTAEYTWYEGLIAEAQKVIDGDPSDRNNYPGYRAAGVQVFVLSPTVYQQLVEATIVVEDGYDSATVLAKCKSAIVRYINGLGINGDVIWSELIHAVQAVNGVHDVTFVSPTANVVIGEGELARVTTANITLTGA